MLDMSVRAKILQLMLDLKQELDLSYVYITHDLASAKFFCDRIAIMYLGRIVEIGPTEEIFANPRAPVHEGAARRDPRAGPGADGGRATCSGARSRTPRARRSAARSTRGAPRRLASAAGSRATCGRCSRSTGPAATPRPTSARRSLVGDLDELDEPSVTARHRQGRTARRPRAAGPDARRGRRPSRFGPASTDIEDDGDGVRVRVPTRARPALRRAGDVEVACVLYPDAVG